MSSNSEAHVYQMKVYLKYIKPLIWRRFLVPGDATLTELHLILQTVIGWENYHLHMFEIEDQRYADEVDDEFGIPGVLLESDFRIDQLVSKPGAVIEYEYDFGDGWEHVIEVEDIREKQVGEVLPLLTAGERNSPPEDVGGPPGYQLYLEALNDRQDPQHEEYLRWRGPFDPEKFNPNRANRVLSLMMGDQEGHPLGSAAAKKLDWITSSYVPLIHMIDKMNAEQFTLAEILPAREDMVVLLEYLRDYKVTGTQAGNLPLKAAKEMSARFVQPPVWEEQITEDMVYRVRSSADIWTIDFLLLLARIGGLVAGGFASRFRLTSDGEAFLELAPVLQIWYMFATWWLEANWLYVIPTIEEFGEGLPAGFQEMVAAHLIALPVGKRFPYELFAEQLITAAHFPWLGADPDRFRTYLHHLFEDMIVIPLTDLGVITPGYENVNRGFYLSSQLVSITLTEFGANLFQSLLPRSSGY
jgi:hypothetical protein